MKWSFKAPGVLSTVIGVFLYYIKSLKWMNFNMYSIYIVSNFVNILKLKSLNGININLHPIKINHI